VTRRLVAVAVLATVAAALAAGIAVRLHQNAAWWQQLRDAQTAITSSQTAPTSWQITGQPPEQHYQQCLDAIASYDQAAAHLQLTQLNPSTECTP
jgi:hypothetical protein